MKDKVSKYNIEVEYSNCMLLYNGLTNALLPVSHKEYAIISTFMDYLSEFENKFPDLYASFKRSGFIIDSNFDELAYIKLQNKKRVFAHNNYHITINPTLECNLKCWYCSVDYAGAKHTRERMSDETINALIKHIDDLITTQKASSILLDWFGGEPLMYFDEVIEKVSEQALRISAEHGVKCYQQITTNGTLLNKERILKMNDANFRFFQISMDGSERRHNQIKFYHDKTPTYRTVIENVNMIADLMPNTVVNLRINYDKQTLKSICDIINDLSENSKKRVRFDFQRVWQVPFDKKVGQYLIDVKKEFQQAGFKSDYWAYKPLRFFRCYADNFHHYVINYNGKVFKCSARDYGDNLVIGNLLPSGKIEWNEDILSKYFNKATFENERCETCKMLPLCMGPCIQKCYETRERNEKNVCLYDNVEISLSNYVIEIAKQKNLVL